MWRMVFLCCTIVFILNAAAALQRDDAVQMIHPSQRLKVLSPLAMREDAQP